MIAVTGIAHHGGRPAEPSRDQLIVLRQNDNDDRDAEQPTKPIVGGAQCERSGRTDDDGAALPATRSVKLLVKLLAIRSSVRPP
jgi:hypothetical protein